MNQTPNQRSRPYDRTEPDKLGDVLSELFALRGYGRVKANQQLEQIWETTVDEHISQQTKVIGLKNGILHIGVTNSALISELSAFLKVEYLEKLQSEQSHLNIKDIKFKLRRNLSQS